MRKQLITDPKVSEVLVEATSELVSRLVMIAESRKGELAPKNFRKINYVLIWIPKLLKEFQWDLENDWQKPFHHFFQCVVINLQMLCKIYEDDECSKLHSVVKLHFKEKFEEYYRAQEKGRRVSLREIEAQYLGDGFMHGGEFRKITTQIENSIYSDTEWYKTKGWQA